jgi:glycosyltransferase involved in cell wall biosynthesis
MPTASFPGVLRGDALATAYANMDAFVFPSHTDTFGNVILEALASGVPAIVTPDGGPAHIVRDGITGRIARVVRDEAEEFAEAIQQVLAANLQSAARAYALGCSWDAVFDRVLAAYPLTPSPSTNL